MKLLKSQKTTLFEYIEQSTLFIPGEFKFSDNGIMVGGSVTEIRHTASNYYFMILGDYLSCSPGYDTVTYKTPHHTQWNIISECFREWLLNLSREISVEDKWEKIEADSKYFDVDEEDNSMFTIGEQKLIVDKIESLKEDVKNIKNVNVSELEKINKKLDHLEEMVSKLGRIDWKNLFLGSMLSVMTGVMIPPDAHHSIMNLFKKLFDGFKLLQ